MSCELGFFEFGFLSKLSNLITNMPLWLLRISSASFDNGGEVIVYIRRYLVYGYMLLG